MLPLLPLYLIIPFCFIWTVCLNVIATYLIKQSFKLQLFPYFEIIGTILLTMLWPTLYPTYFIFFSALLIVIHTDVTSMLISRYTSLYLVPAGIIASYYNLLPIDTTESCCAAFIGYGLLYSVNKLFYMIKQQNGLGQGDLDLLAFIGSFTGFLGIWFTILFGSILGTISGTGYMLYCQKRINILPFGPFLSIGAMLYVLFQSYIFDCFLATF